MLCLPVAEVHDDAELDQNSYREEEADQQPHVDRLYRDEIYSLQILLSRTKAGPGRTVEQDQEEISPNHVLKLNLISVNSYPH